MNTYEKRFLSAKREIFQKAYGYLNSKQRDAVFAVNGPLLILAGAGSGKTTVLVKRIAFIIKYGNAYHSDDIPREMDMNEETVSFFEQFASAQDKPEPAFLCGFASEPCPPWQVLAITFTNKAANEIKSRLCTELDDESIAKDVWAGTFHSICVRILRTHAQKLGYGAGFTIYDTEDTKKAVANAIKECNIDEKVLSVKSAINAISRAKEQLLTPDGYANSFNSTDHKAKLIHRVYTVYQQRLADSNAMDFDDIIMQTVFLLRDFEEVRTYYQRKFKYVSVDEFQDTNKAQLILTELLSSGYRNLMVVGDDDQSIYRFRGATIENILNFDKHYPDAKVIRLEQNYRSTDVIIGAANEVIRHNQGRHEKTLWTEKSGGDKITVRRLDDQNAEVRYILDVIRRQVQSGAHEFRDYAILYRTNAQSSTIERAFAKSGIPYRMLGGTRFNDREEIRDITAYLQLICNHSDRERLKRIINKPRRKIGGTTVDAIEEIADAEGVSMFEVIENCQRYIALARSAKSLLEFAALINELTLIMQEEPLDVFVKETMERSGYRRSIEEKGEEEKDRLDNLDEFLSGVIDYMKRADEPTLTGFLEDNALVTDVDKYDETADAVVMMTVHSSKGLEFPVVFIPGMEDGIFPGLQTVMEGPAAIEEERRLAYVAITRAKKELYILSAESRLLYGRTSYNPPSRFLLDIPEKYIDTPKRSSAAKQAGDIGTSGRWYDPGHSAQPSVGSYHSQSGEARSAKDKYTDRSSSDRSASKASERTAQKVERLGVGDRVRHITFGDGDILSVSPVGADVIYEIMFDNVGIKKLMGTYAKLKKL